MNVTNSEAQPNTTVDTKGDSAKLLSLLALATGAVAMPQTSNADIVFVDLSASPEHIGQLADHDYLITLPGTAQIGFHQHTRVTAISSSRWITGRQQPPAPAYVRFLTQASFILRASAGQTWNQLKNQVGVRASVFGTVAYNTYGHAFPGSFNNKYYMFEFKQSASSPMQFGWISVGLANPVGGNYPDLAINGWAYDTTGQMLGAGQVPEPAAPALLALGALVFGSKGLRSWRKNRKAGASETNSN
jgi:hypothetical protein